MPRIPIASVLTLGVLLTVSSCAGGQGLEKAGTFDRYAVATANPASTRAANEVLAHGGTAMTRRSRPKPFSTGRAAVFRPSAAAPSSSTTTPRPKSSPPTTAAKPRPPPRDRTNSSARTEKPRPFLDQVVGGQSVGIPGHDRDARAGPERTRPPAVERALLAGHRPSPATASPSARACTKLIGEEPTLPNAGHRAQVFLRCERRSVGARHDRQEPRLCRDSARDRRRSARALPWPDRERDHRDGCERAASSGDDHRQRLGELRTARTRGGVRALSHLSRVRHGPAELRRERPSSKSSACSSDSICAPSDPRAPRAGT